MSRVILHIGTHKTATTTVQDTFYVNADLLAEHDFVYPKFRKHTGHHGLVAEWAGLHKGYHLPNGGPAMLAALADRYGDTDKTVFLSSEEFSRGQDGNRADMAELRRLLDPFDEVLVVAVLRDQWQFLQSLYLEVSKNYAPAPPGHLVSAALRTSMFQGVWLDYNLLYDHLLTGFAPDQIRLVDFAGCTAHSGGVIGAMLDLAGVPLSADDLEPVNDGTSNRSALSLAMWAGHFIDNPHKAGTELVDILTGAFETEFGKDARSCLFTRPEARQLNAHFRPLNKKLAGRVADHQPDLSITPALLTGKTVFREDINAGFWMRASRRIGQRLRREMLGLDGKGKAG